jgi:hypothetical protein
MREKTAYTGMGTRGHGISVYQYQVVSILRGFPQEPYISYDIRHKVCTPLQHSTSLCSCWTRSSLGFLCLIHHEIHIISITVNDEPFHRCHLFVHCIGFGLRTCDRSF